MNTTRRGLYLVLLLLVGVIGFNLPRFAAAHSGAAGPSSEVAPPAYDGEGRLLLPANYREWIFVGSSLGLSYTEGEASHEMFHETLMEPGAYRHYVETGEFADGTQLVLILHGTGEGVLPGRRGRFANEIHGVEMAVKDSGRLDEPWGYYGFGGMGGIRQTAEAFPAPSCHDCHAEHAAQDNVFTQFYPLLREAAGVELASERSEPGAAAADEAEPVLAYGGLDPVMLVAGREELGKAEIVEDFRGWRYRFASEPNRAAFAAEPGRFAPRNDSCLVVPGAAIEPDLFAVHEGRVYAFASVNCREEFKSAPAEFLPGPDDVAG